MPGKLEFSVRRFLCRRHCKFSNGESRYMVYRIGFLNCRKLLLNNRFFRAKNRNPAIDGVGCGWWFLGISRWNGLSPWIPIPCLFFPFLHFRHLDFIINQVDGVLDRARTSRLTTGTQGTGEIPHQELCLLPGVWRTWTGCFSRVLVIASQSMPLWLRNVTTTCTVVSEKWKYFWVICRL